jgi:hypothetical protein
MIRTTAAAAAALLSIGTANAANVTPDVIFGSGNANGAFTIDTEGTLELGLRAKLRYNDTGAPEDTFNYDGVDTYTFVQTAGTPSDRSVFNFEWSVNSDTADGSDTLDSYTYLLEYDTDTTAGEAFVSYDPFGDPFTTPATGAYFGNNSSGNGSASFVFVPAELIALQSSNNVGQNSVNYGFLPGAPLGDGIYTIVLSAFADGDMSSPVARTAITVVVGNQVPLPAAFPFMLGGIAGFAALRKRASR